MPTGPSTASPSRRRSRDVGALSLALGAAGVGILALTPELATLEDLFFRLTEGDGDSGDAPTIAPASRRADACRAS